MSWRDKLEALAEEAREIAISNRIAALEAEVATLREALAPFAAKLSWWSDSTELDIPVKIDDLRRARRALGEGK